MVHNIISLFLKWITHSLILFQEKQQLPRNTHQKFSTISFYTCKELTITKHILFGIDMLGLRLWISRNWIDTQSKEIVNIRSIQSILYKCGTILGYIPNNEWFTTIFMNIPFFPSIQWTHIIWHLVSELHFQAAVLCFIAFEMSWDSDVWCETFGRKERARYFCLISYQLEEVCNENYAM